jgi:hypothetical protein
LVKAFALQVTGEAHLRIRGTPSCCDQQAGRNGINGSGRRAVNVHREGSGCGVENIEALAYVKLNPRYWRWDVASNKH